MELPPIDYAGAGAGADDADGRSRGEYIVFEHGPFDFETQNQSVEAKIEAAMKDFDYAASGYALDTTPGRVFLFLPRLHPILEVHPPGTKAVIMTNPELRPQFRVLACSYRLAAEKFRRFLDPVLRLPHRFFLYGSCAESTVQPPPQRNL